MVFTGIIKAVGRAVPDKVSNTLTVTVPVEYKSFWSGCVQGDSVAVDGVCLTLLEKPKNRSATFFVMEQTRSTTTLDFCTAFSSCTKLTPFS